MKKKMFVVLALVLSLSLVLMACGGSKDDANSGDSKVLNVWAMGDEAKSLKNSHKNSRKKLASRSKYKLFLGRMHMINYLQPLLLNLAPM